MKKRHYIILLSILFIIIVFQIPFVQKAAAIIRTSIYVNHHYSEKKPEFQFIEYSSQFESYFVHFKTQNEQEFGIQVTPKFFPLIIAYDPLDLD